MTDYAALREAMVDSQIRPSDVTRYHVIHAFLTTPREAFVPRDKRPVAYAGEHIPLGGGRVVPDPRVLARLLDALDPGPGDLVLDIGPGLGYSTAVIAAMAEAVIAVESDPALAAEAEAALQAQAVDNAIVVTGPLEAGAPRHGPYDLIVIAGGVEQIPQAIADQLKEDGRIGAIFMEGEAGHCRIGVKRAGAIAWRTAFDATAPVLPGFTREEVFAL